MLHGFDLIAGFQAQRSSINAVSDHYRPNPKANPLNSVDEFGDASFEDKLRRAESKNVPTSMGATVDILR
jgi:hypothetical protein